VAKNMFLFSIKGFEILFLEILSTEVVLPVSMSIIRSFPLLVDK
jgi:hypothetical protein